MEKNAFHFLGISVGWEEWQQVKDFRKNIETAISGGASQALIQILENIYAQYQQQVKRDKAVFGPWIWRGAYALTRMTRRISRGNIPAQEAIRLLKNTSLQATQIRFVGLAARWAELLKR